MDDKRGRSVFTLLRGHIGMAERTAGAWVGTGLRLGNRLPFAEPTRFPDAPVVAFGANYAGEPPVLACSLWAAMALPALVGPVCSRFPLISRQDVPASLTE